MHYNIHINKGKTNHLRLYLGWNLFETKRKTERLKQGKTDKKGQPNFFNYRLAKYT